MIGDQNKFNSLKKRKGGNVAFGNESFVKILGKGVVILENEKLKEKNVLLVEDLKISLVLEKCVIKDTISYSILDNLKLEKHI